MTDAFNEPSGFREATGYRLSEATVFREDAGSRHPKALESARELTVSVKLLATVSVKLLASAKPLALRHPKALGEASVTASYDVRRLQPSEDPLTIQQKLRSPSSTVRSQHRTGRSLGPVLTLEFNRTCLLFCDGENITDAISRPPNFTQCPASVTLYPERGSTEVTYTWTEPIAIDWDGNLTVVQKIFGANSTSSFESYVSPGTRHMISYLATDLDNKNWTCAFTITAEIPTCPPIVHLENGFLNCTDDNLRASVCEFSCYHGYQLNATSTVECQDNGTWSGQGVPQCLPVVCDGNINSTLTDSRLNVVCEKTVTGVFGDVCWLTCHDNFRLRNDLLGAHILYTLNNSLTLAEQAYENASIEAERSRNDTLEANMNSTLLASLLEAVKNTTKSLEIEFQNVTQMVNAASAQLSQLVQQFNKTRADLDLTDNHTEINDLKNNISDLERRLDEKNITLNNLLFEMTTTEHELNETRMKESVASEKAFKAKEIARVKELAAMAAKSTLVVAASELDAAREAYENASVYVTSGLRTVATDVTCNSSGVWQVQGQPYCEDVTAPSLKCVPVYTFYLDPNQTVGIVTWPEPEVDDNSNSATVRHVSGPSPGEILTSGRHVVKYEAVDNVNNTSPVCTVVINVKEVVCEDLGQVIGQSTISYTCDSFELGTTCSLACDSRDVIDGPDHVTCMLDFETGFPFWNWENTTCLSENCSQPAAPIHGYISCFYEDILVTNVTDGNVTAGNVTSNRTEETFVCEFSCAEGYMLPYATLNRYTCSGNDVWNSEFFPATCIETGAELSTQHSFLLTYDITSCDLDEIHELATDWKNVVSEELPSFSDCMSGFLCDMGDVSYQCNADNTSVTVTFSVHVSCEEVFATALPLEATCDLTENKMASLLTSQEGSSSIRLFIKNRLPAAADLFADNVTVPECPGSVLIGAYCARCPAGSFYARSLDRCILCPVGSYTETPGRDFCTSCPQDQATLQAGSVQPHECRDICRAGSYSYTTVAPCSPCPTGTYQGHVASVACSPCPAGTWTQSEGSTSLADCIAYDLYFDDDVADILLTSVGQEFSVVLWTSSIAVTSLTLGVFGDSGEPLFILRARSNSSNLYFDSWDSEPVNLDLVSDMWTMLGVTWSAESRDVHLYQDVKHVYSIQIQASEPATQLRISAGNQTFVSGLSISNRTANSAILSSVYSTCGTSLPAEVISLDHVAAQRLPHVNVAASSCQGTQVVTFH
ncbi:uncharacterized protein LOC127839712 [Dreissena polymorpha]|uniref:uncharacterized protein LOC127839712 n=1 Tax=Dreissena polymorpha TaxID=45954 RepID=UPI002263DDFA|nr:uncharacterized protein LOC127839712 [Dreissena polymorpha]